jgi:HAD superfamily 5'-nucleotidase-like hydrolase
LLRNETSSTIIGGTGQTIVDRWSYDSVNVPLAQRIFANNELNLGVIDAWGFDYDYTLTNYQPAFPELIYDLAKRRLVRTQGFPEELLTRVYDPTFAIRGLHYDRRTGIILQMDYFRHVQTPQAQTVWQTQLQDTVGMVGIQYSDRGQDEATAPNTHSDVGRLTGSAHFGRQRLTTAQVFEVFGTTRLPAQYIESNLVPLYDLFSVPTSCLIADAIHVLHLRGELPFPTVGVQGDSTARLGGVQLGSGRVGDDVLESVRYVVGKEVQPQMQRDIGKYLAPSPKVAIVLRRLREAGKQTFLLTNSSFSFVDLGMRQLVRGSEEVIPSAWPSLFDVIVCQANKPHFFGLSPVEELLNRRAEVANNEPFAHAARRHTGGQAAVPDMEEEEEEEEGGEEWATEEDAWGEEESGGGPVLVGGGGGSLGEDSSAPSTLVCVGGSVGALLEITGWTRQGSVLYFGDHFAADMLQPSRQHGWRTAMVLAELEEELTRQECPEYLDAMQRLVKTEAAIRNAQLLSDKEELGWLRSRSSQIRAYLRQRTNQNFGSVFRTQLNATCFINDVQQYADVYTGNIENLLHYPIDYSFYPKRRWLPHETPVY